MKIFALRTLFTTIIAFTATLAPGLSMAQAALATQATQSAQATDSTRPVKLIVSLSAGTALDRAARWAADLLEKELGQTVIVENRPGASGLIATEQVMRAAPDGSTLLFGGSTMALSASLANARAPHPAKALQPIARLTTQPILLVAGSKLAPRSMSELINHAKVAGAALSYATGGVGSPGHFSGSMFARTTGVDLVHVPYPTAGALNRDVLSGQVDLSFNVLPSVDPHLRSGQFRAFATTGTRRLVAFPEVPTFAELGLGDDYPVSWYGVFAPPGTAATIVQRVSGALKRAIDKPEQRATLAATGLLADFRDSVQFTADLHAEVARATEVARRENIGAE